MVLVSLSIKSQLYRWASPILIIKPAATSVRNYRAQVLKCTLEASGAEQVSSDRPSTQVYFAVRFVHDFF